MERRLKERLEKEKMEKELVEKYSNEYLLLLRRKAPEFDEKDFQTVPDEEVKEKERKDEKPVKKEEQMELFKTCENSELASPSEKVNDYFDAHFEKDLIEKLVKEKDKLQP